MIPIIVEIMSAIFKNASKLSEFTGVSPNFFYEVHNVFMGVYSIFITVLLADIFWYFVKKCFRNHQ